MTSQPSAFDPVGFLDLADRLSQSSAQAELRSALSRGYYAPFLKARDKLGIQTQTADVHGQVMRALGLQSRMNSSELERLRRARNLADYDTLAVLNTTEVQRIVRRARELFARL